MAEAEAYATMWVCVQNEKTCFYLTSHNLHDESSALIQSSPYSRSIAQGFVIPKLRLSDILLWSNRRNSYIKHEKVAIVKFDALFFLNFDREQQISTQIWDLWVYPQICDTCI